MSRKTKIGLVVIIILAVGLFWFFYAGGIDLFNKKPSGEQANSINGAPVVDSNGQPVVNGETIAQEQSKSLLSTTTAPQTVARFFAERYGSYSNESNFANIKELYPFMTTVLRQQMENYVVSQENSGVARQTTYSGITTKVVTIAVKTNIADTAELTLSTQRKETAQGQADKIYYQDIDVGLLRAGDEWKVDKVQWK